VFNIQGSEIIIILLLALVVLGPEKLPEAMRKAGRMYADLKKVSTGFQQEFRAAMDEPMREMKDTANLLRDSADFTKLQAGERDEKPKSAEMGDAPGMALAPADPDAVPVDDVPFAPGGVSAPVGSDVFGDLPTPHDDQHDDQRDDQADGDDDDRGDRADGDDDRTPEAG
jgi:sec-independent protein translocase protein TatB